MLKAAVSERQDFVRLLCNRKFVEILWLLCMVFIMGVGSVAGRQCSALLMFQLRQQLFSFPSDSRNKAFISRCYLHRARKLVRAKTPHFSDSREERMTKFTSLMTTTALAVLIAAPAFAQSSKAAWRFEELVA